MIIKKNIQLKNGIVISFGSPDNQSELDEMFTLRHQVYVKEKKYISSNTYSDDLDIDKHDKENHCAYFIAKINDKIVGTARVIQTNPLPTESDYFEFKAPKTISEIPPEHRAEIGRIISRPHQIVNVQVPRSIIMLGILYIIAEYGTEQGILGGYGSIKQSALQKLTSMGIPIKEIKKYKLIFEPGKSDDPLTNFFSKEDEVKLVYFKTLDVFKYLRNVLNNKKLFTQIDRMTFLFNEHKLTLFDKIIVRLKS